MSTSSVTGSGNCIDIVTAGRETSVHVSHLALEKLVWEEGRNVWKQGRREKGGQGREGRKEVERRSKKPVMQYPQEKLPGDMNIVEHTVYLPI